MIVTTTVGRPTVVPGRAAVAAVAFSGVDPAGEPDSLALVLSALVLSALVLSALGSSALVVLASAGLDAAVAVFVGTAAVVVTAHDPVSL